MKLKHRYEIDGLRAVAVFPVVMFHAEFDLFKGGFVGVDIFFVISGYLITSLIITEQQAGLFTLMKFYERRARRILPALFMVVLLCIPFAWFWMLPAEWSAFSKSLISVPAFVSNVQFFLEAGYFDVASRYKPLLHTWSLAVEEQFYVFFPILLILVWKIRRNYLLGVVVGIGVISIVLAQVSVSSYPSAAFYLLPTRGWELMLGASVSILQVFNKLPEQKTPIYQCLVLVGLVLIAYSIFSFDREVQVPGMYTLMPTLGTALIILFADSRSWVGKILSSRLLVSIGLVSYSWYLWHYPILVFGRLGILNELDNQLKSVLILVSLFLAYVSWKFIEQPCRDQNKITKKVFTYSICMLAILILTIGVIANNYLKQPTEILIWLDKVVRIDLEGMKPSSRELCVSDEMESGCLVSATNDKPTITIIGDSQARALSESLYAFAVPQGFGLLDLTKGGCPFLLNLQLFVSHKPNNNCRPQYQEERLQKLRQFNNLVVVIHSKLPMYIYGNGFSNGRGGIEIHEPYYMSKMPNSTIHERKQQILRAFVNTVERVVALGHKVVIVDPVPTNGWDPIRRLKLIEKYGLSQSFQQTAEYMKISEGIVLERQQSSREIIKSVIDQFGDMVGRVETFPIFCNSHIKKFCSSVSRNSVLYSDRDHVSLDGGLPITEQIVAIISARENSKK